MPLMGGRQFNLATTDNEMERRRSKSHKGALDAKRESAKISRRRVRGIENLAVSCVAGCKRRKRNEFL